MRTALVLTIIGDDKPGIVEQLSQEVLAAGANWEESRMARLAGKFAGVLRVSVDAARAEDLAARLGTLGAGRLTVVVERSVDAVPETSRTYGLELVGHDRPGIVRDISHVLAQQGVNIEELETELTSGAMSGDALFRARARVRIPATLAVERLRSTLEALAHDLMVDLAFAGPDS
jgi:glycine cleavage system regulatory protein